MFKTTIENDLKNAVTNEEREAAYEKIFNKYRGEFFEFIEELKKSKIAQKLFDSSTPEETLHIREEFSSQNQWLFEKIKSWAKARDE